MSDSQVSAFLSAIAQDESAHVRWREAASVDEVVVLAKELGFSIDSSELLALLDDSVLSDSDLANVAGGGMSRDELEAEFADLGEPGAGGGLWSYSPGR